MITHRRDTPFSVSSRSDKSKEDRSKQDLLLATGVSTRFLRGGSGAGLLGRSVFLPRQEWDQLPGTARFLAAEGAVLQCQPRLAGTRQAGGAQPCGGAFCLSRRPGVPKGCRGAARPSCPGRRPSGSAPAPLRQTRTLGRVLPRSPPSVPGSPGRSRSRDPRPERGAGTRIK